MSIKFIQKEIEEIKKDLRGDIAQLERKQDKHNNLIERTTLNEASTSSAHKRLDEFRSELHEIFHQLREQIKELHR